jgi:hypothetical protein
MKKHDLELFQIVIAAIKEEQAKRAELLEAAKGILEWCEDNFAGEDSGPDLTALRAAIAKAERGA